MKIRDFHVENYRSLKNVTLSNLGRLNILIGKNSAGKSNLIEALNLFFAEYSNTGGTTPGLDEYFWYRGITKTPVLFRVTILLTDEELEQVFDKQTVGRVKEKFGEKYNVIEIQRSIINPQGNWTTDYMKWADAPLIENDKAKLFRNAGPSAQIPASGPEQASASMPVAENSFAGVQNDLPQLLKSSFKLLTVARDGRNADRFRVTLTDDSVQTQVWNMDQAVMSPDEDKYSVFESTFEGLTGMRMDPAQGKLMVRKEMRRFPLGLEGGGIQTSANLLYSMLIQGEQSSILAIEEPETHVHPELQRKLGRELRKLSKEKQLFVATHSPSFLSTDEESRTWLIRLAGSETQVTPVPTDKLQTNLGEVGLRPSDLLFNNNKIVFVEGKSDRIILAAFAERLGIDLMNIELVPIHRKKKSALMLEDWIGLTKNVVPIYFILDPEAQPELNQAISKGLADKASAHVWRAGPIEKYYPTKILSESLEELSKRYSLGLDAAKIMKKIESGDIQPDKIEIGSKREQLDETWDILLAEEVARRIKSGSGEIAEEVKEALADATALPY